MFHLDTFRPEAPLARTLSEEVARVVRGRAANPKCIAGVMRHSYKGAFEIAATVDYLFGFAASTEAVKTHYFDQLFSAYLEDETVRGFMGRVQPGRPRRDGRALRRGHAPGHVDPPLQPRGRAAGGAGGGSAAFTCPSP